MPILHEDGQMKKAKKSILCTRWENRRVFNGETRLSVSGSRTLQDERVKILILEQIQKHSVTRVTTHGEPGGVCELTKKICREHAIPLTLHFLNFAKLQGAFYHRSLAVFYDTDIALFIHDGERKGTQNEYAVAQKMRIPSEYYQLDPPKHDKSVGFDVADNEWADLDIDIDLDF